MDNIVVLKAADDVGNGVDLANVRKKFVAKSSLAGALDKSGNIDEFNHRVGGFGGFIHFGQPVQTLVRNTDHTYIRVGVQNG